MGNFARQFFSRTTAPTNSLILSVGRHDLAMSDFLEMDEYARVNTRDGIGEYRKSCTDGKVWTVFAYLSCPLMHPPVFEFLMGAMDTADLQVISWNKAYSLYPYVTFVKKEKYYLHVSFANIHHLETANTEEDIQFTWCKRKKNILAASSTIDHGS
jgi:hypothetical protein